MSTTTTVKRVIAKKGFFKTLITGDRIKHVRCGYYCLPSFNYYKRKFLKLQKSSEVKVTIDILNVKEWNVALEYKIIRKLCESKWSWKRLRKILKKVNELTLSINFNIRDVKIKEFEEESKEEFEDSEEESASTDNWYTDFILFRFRLQKICKKKSIIYVDVDSGRI